MAEATVAADVPDGTLALPWISAERTAEFTALYTSTFREVSGYCAALLKDDALAADMAQEAFVRLFARWRKVDNPRGFLFLVATNLVRDEWRWQRRQRTLVTALAPLVGHSAPAADPALPDVVARLPRNLREVVVLHIVADLPLAEVARITGLPLGTVKRRLYDARARLRLDWTDTP